MIAPTAIRDVQPEILTDGRLGLVERMLEDLKVGLINPFSVPLQ